MDLTPYVDDLRNELVAAAEAGGDESRALAERLVGPLESATRLALLEALSAAADEITRELAPGAVEVRLRGRDPEFVVAVPPAGEPLGVEAGDRGFPPPPSSSSSSSSSATVDEDEGGTSRITLRLPTHLKPRIDEAANRAGLSANAWLVRVVAAALEPGDRARAADRRATARRTTGSRWYGGRQTGWVR
jgi:hypothetical protein